MHVNGRDDMRDDPRTDGRVSPRTSARAGRIALSSDSRASTSQPSGLPASTNTRRLETRTVQARNVDPSGHQSKC